MEAKIRVHGKSQSRTALGIINAYLKLYPNSSLFDLQQAFPHSLNPKSFADQIIVPHAEAKKHGELFFEKEDELITLRNGKKLSLVELWTKENFEAITEHAKQYGIEVAEMEGTKPFERGSFELEYLNGFIPVKVEDLPIEESADDEKCSWWWWLLGLLLLLLICIFCFRNCCCECCGKQDDVIMATPIIENEVDSTNIFSNIKGKLDTIANNFIYDTGDTINIQFPDGKELKVGNNSSEYKLYQFLKSDAEVDTLDKSKNWITLDRLYFETGKANLTPDSEKQLQNIATILSYFPNAHIKMGGYTDNTGTEEINMKLSVERAKVAADNLIANGVDAGRVKYEGYGQNHPLCPPNDTDECRAINRRIDVRITKK